ncbi:MAG: hypothetical protein WCI72_01420 [archaeon]
MVERSLKSIKEDYKKIEEKLSLPSFEKLMEDFDMEKLSEKEEGLLVRDVRRIITEKISAYLHLFEMLINPTSPPMFVFAFLKNLSEQDKKEIKEVYKELSKLQIVTIKLDTIYDEKKEADFIKKANSTWQDLKKKVYKLVETFEKEFEKNVETKEKSYFG